MNDPGCGLVISHKDSMTVCLFFFFFFTDGNQDGDQVVVTMSLKMLLHCFSASFYLISCFIVFVLPPVSFL